MAKFKMEMVTGEDGKLVRKWIPIENETESAPEVGSVHGGYVKTDLERVEEAKKVLLEDMFAYIRKLAKNDSFWIVKQAGDNTVTVGWKVEFPQMESH